MTNLFCFMQPTDVRHRNHNRVRRSLPLLAALVAATCLRASPRTVWSDKPAAHFTDAYPQGNGRLGVMVFGGVRDERIVLNESGMWSGSPQEADRPHASDALPEIRKLLLAGKNFEAEQLVNKTFTCAGAGSGFGNGAKVPYGCYQTLGNLHLVFRHDGVDEPVEDYRRELDLRTAISRVSYRQAGVRYSRETLVSAPDEVVAMRLAASGVGGLSFDVLLDRPERSETVAPDDTTLEMYGQLNDGREGGTGVRFAARVKVLALGGSVEAADGGLRVRGADEAILYFTAATDIKTFAGRRIEDARAAAKADLDRVLGKSLYDVRLDHVTAYKKLFDRVSLDLGTREQFEAVSKLTTLKRLEAFQNGLEDPDLVALYFDFGRYLLISSTRPDGLPPNLQGIWAEEIQTPWNGDWHANINVQMNFWPAEVCNLSELHKSLFSLIASLQEPGAKTAQAYYNARGWVAFLLLNPWGFTSPGESASWGSTVSCSAWLCSHLWDHYLFTRDRAFLEWAYPIMRGSALFYLDMLIEEPTHHWLVTAPSNSPENSFRDEEGREVHTCMGPTADEQMLRYLFGACIEASDILGVDADLRAELSEARSRLEPTRIGSDGRIMEWMQEYTEVDPHHRHVSHLWGLYPGDEIDPARSPGLAAAAAKSLDARGDEGTGWGLANKLAMRARLGDGERAYHLLRQALKVANQETEKHEFSGGTFASLLDSHPPFQIDGNFGGTAAIGEMLVQSSVEGALRDPAQTKTRVALLPALPAEWATGHVSGLCARGGYQVDLSWSAGTLDKVVIHANLGGTLHLVFGDASVDVSTEAGHDYAFDGELKPQS